MVVVQVRLTDEEAERLAELAYQKKLSVEEFLHEIVVEHLLRPAELTMDEKRRRAAPCPASTRT